MTGAQMAFSFEPNPSAGPRIKAALERGAIAGAEHILNVSNSQVPHEEGDLERTGVITKVGDGEAAISYDTPYAVRQHEDLSYRHDPGRNAKFLENACRSEARTVGTIIATTVRRAT